MAREGETPVALRAPSVSPSIPAVCLGLICILLTYLGVGDFCVITVGDFSVVTTKGAMFLLGSYAAMHEDILIDLDTMQAIDERFDDFTEINSFNDDDVQWICSRAREIKNEYERI